MELKELAKEIADVYMHNPKIESVMLGGSVARNLSDEFSDIELFIFWRESPTDEDRKEPIEKLGGNILDFHPFEDEEWSETYTVQNVKLEISSFLLNTAFQYSEDVTLKYDTDLEKQVLLSSIDDGIPLGGEKALFELKGKIKLYPVKLGEAMVKENRELGTRWQNREALLAREDWLMLYQIIVAVEVKLMGILFALNQRYVHHPAFKWQKASLDNMEIKPENSSERFASVLLGEPKESLEELEQLILEVFQLAQTLYPNFDMSGAMEKAGWARPKNS
ncbi:DUF4037 domain-containing protein [Planococcus shenhongbingii]|uniref:DUF4037 domain-containing protein n=1 Tax=Planococcus shenhongbingii TaxID=3058398 RepID=A0ABT8N8P8_9BACL|nr:DUF4037 domain-containing protein [Planococcus sp. N017]MDN7244118.1 DUF4037 domain-containing protein [Planococcus sp. N017]